METPTDRSQTPQGETGSPRTAAEPAICDPGYHASGPWCSRCGQWFVDGEWRNTPPETTRSPWRRMVNVIDLDGDLITALGDLTDRYGVAGVRKAMGILWPLEPVELRPKRQTIEAGYAEGGIFSESSRDPADVHEYAPAEEHNTFSEVLPIEAVIIDGLTIEGNQFEMGSLQHDVNMGAVSIKFIGVRKLETIYKHGLMG